MAFAASHEDAWLMDFFGRDFVGYAVDVGAAGGVESSNTLALEHAGWTVLCIEPNPYFESILKDGRPLVWMGACSDFCGPATFHLNTNTPSGFSSLRPTYDHPQWHPGKDDVWETYEVEVKTLDELLAEYKFPHLDFLSIDTEGTELDVLHGIDLKVWTPRVIICENWDVDSPVLHYLREQGYERVERRLVNDIFVRTE